ncbi:MAG TPA: DUF1127 domain-containing protein [Pseudomonas xinjiangensis]|uniref:DUF1127 domain-containing protein n=2 Tax=root TaxID=1 RepID=A0A7V1FTT3_9GAMM|nr:DUF1127 domain-containing protein [Halopseudomonas xinjiangensis]HEC47921.1 DUF1127 domain-containing protein [Halopseudomonas xinjiangensis]
MYSESGCLRFIKAAVSGWFSRINRWRRLAYERRLLSSMDERMLRDIGVSRSDAERESARHFWDDSSVLRRSGRE